MHNNRFHYGACLHCDRTVISHAPDINREKGKGVEGNWHPWGPHPTLVNAWSWGKGNIHVISSCSDLARWVVISSSQRSRTWNSEGLETHSQDHLISHCTSSSPELFPSPKKNESTLSTCLKSKAPTKKEQRLVSLSIANPPFLPALEEPLLHAGQAQWSVEMQSLSYIFGIHLETPRVSLHLLSCLFLLHKKNCRCI